ncbi:MAG: DEAD/DEAH box helicase [Candidatus Thermoplasmatota archaeon]|nr:DEAD/DEAH box helicase [Candidatus Thermoplasmatota archaeon]
MRVDELGLDDRIVKSLSEDGISELYPPQAEAILPALEGKNLVLAVPTASGKSLVAYMAILKAVLRGGKALYIVPLKALASEKFEDLSKFETLGIKVGESTGDYDEVDPMLHKYDIVIATSEKADSLLRHRAKWLDQLSVVVADEVHLIHDPERGPTLEVTLAKFRKFNPDAQVIALSATIRNASELAAWLDAELVTSQWRPVTLREGVYLDGEIFFTDNTRRALPKEDEPLHAIVKGALGSGGQSLIFVNSRRSTEALASQLGPIVRATAEFKELELAKVAKRLIGEQEEPTSMGRKLGMCIKSGCAFHHAGLTGPQRRLVEASFRQGMIRCIVATPTLAAGINLPARTVIVRDVRRYDANVGFTSIPVLEIKQMCGRAGRPRFDTYGEAILVARDEEDKEFMLEEYLLGENENIYSKLGTEPAIRSHVLALVATKAASSLGELTEFFGRTFLSHQTDIGYLGDMITGVVDFLKTEGMLRDQEELRATLFGKHVSDLYLDPKSATGIRDALGRWAPGHAFGLLHAVCAVPDMQQLYLRGSDYGWVEEYAAQVHDQLLIDPPDDLRKYDFFLSEVKTAKLLNDWISEVHENDIAKGFGIGPGDIRNKMELAEWLMHGAARLAELFNEDAVEEALELRTRLRYGIRPELLELVKLKGIGRARARALHDRGIKTIEDLRNTSYDWLKQIPTIGEAVARSVKSQLGQSERGIPEEPADGQRSLRHYR